MRVGHTGTCAIVGAGMAGLTVADRLRDMGVAVTVFEKSRGPGGRLATRRTTEGHFDHGAPRIEAKSDAFIQFLTSLGSAKEDGIGFRGLPFMRALLDPIAARTRVRWKVAVQRVEHRARGWFVVTENGGDHGPFDAVVITSPAPQAARIVNGANLAISDELACVEMEPVWTGLLRFDQAIRLPGDLAGGSAHASDPDDDGASQGWVVHMGQEWSRTHLENDAPFAAVLLLDELENALGEKLPPTRHLTAHRWRFARAARPLGRPCVACRDTGLWVGGDWALGRSAEDAWHSGRNMAEGVLERAGAV